MIGFRYLCIYCYEKCFNSKMGKLKLRKCQFPLAAPKWHKNLTKQDINIKRLELMQLLSIFCYVEHYDWQLNLFAKLQAKSTQFNAWLTYNHVEQAERVSSFKKLHCVIWKKNLFFHSDLNYQNASWKIFNIRFILSGHEILS